MGLLEKEQARKGHKLAEEWIYPKIFPNFSHLENNAEPVTMPADEEDNKSKLDEAVKKQIQRTCLDKDHHHRYTYIEKTLS